MGTEGRCKQVYRSKRAMRGLRCGEDVRLSEATDFIRLHVSNGTTARIKHALTCGTDD